MQTFLIKRSDESSIDLLSPRNDVLKHNMPLYLYDKAEKDTEYDVIVYSAHDPEVETFLQNLPGVNKAVKVAVVSYVPPLSSAQVLTLYKNIWYSNAIASSTFNTVELKNVINLERSIAVNIDGVDVETISNIEEPDDKIEKGKIYLCPFILLSEHSSFWAAIMEQTKEDDSPCVFSPKLRSNSVPISYQPICPTLANSVINFTGFGSFGTSESTRHMYDCRLLHTLNIRLQNLINLVGSAAAAPVKEAVKDYLEELHTLHEHYIEYSATLGKNPIQKQSANVSLVDRIFNVLNSKLSNNV
jgi:predicted DNA-binding protein